jgi:hypothetical protein
VQTDPDSDLSGEGSASESGGSTSGEEYNTDDFESDVDPDDRSAAARAAPWR